MAKWASLSDKIVFEMQHSPTELGYKPNIANYAEQDLLQGKPRLQRLATNLQEIKILCKFHFFILPYYKLRTALQDAAANAEVLQWIFGNGEALGDFVIIDWNEKVKKTDEEGNVFATEIEITLKEYAGPGVAEQTGIDARKRAFANKPYTLTKNVVLPTSSVSSASAGVQMIKVEQLKMVKKLNLLQKGLISIEKFKRDVVPMLGKIQKAKNNIDSAVAIAKNLKNANALTSALSLVGVATNSMQLAVGGNSTVAQLADGVNNLSNVTGSMSNAAEPMQAVNSWFPSIGF